MISFKIITTILITLVCSAYGINITFKGTVKDSSGNGIKDALVRFEECPLSNTTADDGSFMISGNYTSIINDGSIHDRKLLCIDYSGIRPCLQLSVPSNLSLIVYDVQGRQMYHDEVATPIQKYFFNIDRMVDGFYLLHLRYGENSCNAKVNKIGRQYTFSFKNSGAWLNASTSIEASAKESFKDVLVVEKQGYIDYREDIVSADSSGLEIRMINSAGTIKDNDGNEYQTVQVGTQIWTAQNFRCTTLVNNKKIRNGVTVGYGYVTDPKFGYYETDYTSVEKKKKYGVMYNWYVISTGLLAPEGWRVPSCADWDTMAAYLVSNGYNCNKTSGEKRSIGKALASKTGWWSVKDSCKVGFNQRTNNSTGFSGIPAGHYFEVKNFWYRGYNAYWWASDSTGYEDAATYCLDAEKDDLIRQNQSMNLHLSVRLIKK